MSAGTSAPSVAVVVPVFNGESYLAEALEALLSQDHRPLEIVVVDDGSTDTTATVAQAYAGVRYLRQGNAGPSAARNTGMASTGAELLTFCDCDDRYLPGKVSRQVARLVAEPEVGCVLVRHRTFFAPGVERPEWLTEDEGVQPQSAMVRRAVVEEVGGFDPGYRLTEGFEWLSRMRSAGVRIDVLDEVLVDRRIHGANLSYGRRDLQQFMLRSIRDRVALARRSDHA